MLTALLDGQKILATDPIWDGRKEELRVLCNGRAVCPVCSEPIICKFGQHRIHHYAHSRGADCPGNRETIEHLLGKDLLYKFLKEHLGDLAEVEVEYPLPELHSTCDLLIRLPDDRYRAVEFFCGQWKEKELRDRLDYYQSKAIEVVWLISINRYQVQENLQTNIKLRVQERLLLASSGLDKFYVNDWYKKIVLQGEYFPLPTDDSAGGTLNFFDVEGKKLKIIRDVNPSGCVTTYRIGAVIEGSLDEVQISLKRHVWYLKKEEVWKERWLLAKELFAEMKAKKEADDKEYARNWFGDFDNPRKLGLNGSLNDAGVGQVRKKVDERVANQAAQELEGIVSGNNSRDSWPAVEDVAEYHCSKCDGLFFEADMVSYKLDTKEGLCRECSRSRK
jgi:hypothetical protein